MSARQVVALGGAAVGALVALNGALSATPPTPPVPMPGNSRRYDWKLGAIHYTIAGSGPSIVLVHGFGVASSSFEFRYIIDILARSYRVFALDMLGFGMSGHPGISYTGTLYVELLTDFLRHVVAVPSTILAAGSSAPLAVTVAHASASLVDRVILSAPGFPDGRPELPGPLRVATTALLATPVLGPTLFRTMTARNAIRSYLREHAYSNPALVTESMVDAHFAVAHQAGALPAVQAYLAGKLRIDCRKALGSLRQPLCVLVGAAAEMETRACTVQYVRLTPHAAVRVIARSALVPHEEQAERVAAAIKVEQPE